VALLHVRGEARSLESPYTKGDGIVRGGVAQEIALLTIRGVTARLNRTVAERPVTRSTVALHLKRLWLG
jgi:hypothetical protein